MALFPKRFSIKLIPFHLIFFCLLSDVLGIMKWTNQGVGIVCFCKKCPGFLQLMIGLCSHGEQE